MMLWFGGMYFEISGISLSSLRNLEDFNADVFSAVSPSSWANPSNSTPRLSSAMKTPSLRDRAPVRRRWRPSRRNWRWKRPFTDLGTLSLPLSPLYSIYSTDLHRVWRKLSRPETNLLSLPFFFIILNSSSSSPGIDRHHLFSPHGFLFFYQALHRTYNIRFFAPALSRKCTL